MPPRIYKAAPLELLPFPSLPSRLCYQCLRTPEARQFSSTPNHGTRLRKNMFQWLEGPGAVFKQPLPGSTNYLNAYDAGGRMIRAVRGRQNSEGKENSDEEVGEDELERQNLADGTSIPKETLDDLVPFPMNRQFRSQPVLSEELKEAIWNRVVVGGKSVRECSAHYGVEMNRVGAVVRLKSVEKEWEKQGRPLASAYNRAILAMLPQTKYRSNPTAHESINDLPTHRATKIQLFHPVSESRAFTRTDAGLVFEKGLLPADARIPHPQLIRLAKDNQAGVTWQEQTKRLEEEYRLENVERGERAKKRREKVESRTTVVAGRRGEFRFTDVKVSKETVGKDGRGRFGVGARYGMPHQDRKKGIIKIPRRVE